MTEIYYIPGREDDDLKIYFQRNHTTLKAILEELMDLRAYKRDVRFRRENFVEEINSLRNSNYYKLLEEHKTLKEQYQILENVVESYKKWFKDREYTKAKV